MPDGEHRREREKRPVAYLFMVARVLMALALSSRHKALRRDGFPLVAANVSCQKAGRRVVLSGVSERVLRMLKITRVESLFLTFPTLEDAIGGLTRAGAA